MVVALSRAAAADAAERIEVDYDPLPAINDVDTALTGENVLFGPGDEPRLAPGSMWDDRDRPAGNIISHWATGDDRVERCEVIVELEVENPRQSPAPIEPRGVVARWSDDKRLEVWAATQRPHGFRDQLARLYGLDPSDIRVVAGPRVGGGFGGKVSRSVEEHLIPLLARRVGRPVEWIETRTEYQVASSHGRGERVRIRLGGRPDGTIDAAAIRIVKDLGAYPGSSTHLPTTFARPMGAGPYAVEDVGFESIGVVTNRVPTGAFRGAGRAPLIAALERTVDLFARRVGRDPAAVRRRNLIPPAQMPHRSAGGALIDEADYPAALDAALSAAGYRELREEQDRRRIADAPIQLGIGIACYNHMTVGGGGESASVAIRPDGGATVVTGTTSQGQGHATTWAQIAADALALPIDCIEVVEGDTDAIGDGVGAVSSRSLQTAGVAVHLAAQRVVDEAREVAAALLEAATTDIVLDRERGMFHVVGTPFRVATWAEIAAAIDENGGELSCLDHHDVGEFPTFPSGCHVAVVEVDAETGGVRLRRFVAVDDAGTRVHPTIVEGQLHGGIAAGVGQVLGECVAFDEWANPITTNFADYPILSAAELPSFELHDATTTTSFNPHGFKGVGESGTIGATPALHNAIVDALAPFGVEHLNLPCTPDRVWMAIRSGRRSG